MIVPYGPRCLRRASPAPAALVACLMAAGAFGCATPPEPAVTRVWIVGQAAPTLDPQGPPDPTRWALQRMLAQGLVDEDSTGAVVPAAAESIDVSADGLRYRFRLRSDLHFADGTRCRSRDFRATFERAVVRLDHSTYAWLLGAVTGMDRVRPGRPLPALGIETPDSLTFVLQLSRRDSLLLRKLAVPGLAPWREAATAGRWGGGTGGFRVLDASPSRWTLVPQRPGADLADTLRVRFVPGAARVRAALREGAADVVWPLPPDLLDLTVPPPYSERVHDSLPIRWLYLVLRADLPPTTGVEARRAIAHGVDRGPALGALGQRGRESLGWLAGPGVPAGPGFPRYDPAMVESWLARGRLGRSLHVVLSYSLDGAGARVARLLQAGWARAGIDVELRPLRQPAVAEARLRRGGAQLMLVESQALVADPAADLAALVEPMRGPAVGSFRTGWRTREFDAWIAGGAPDVGRAQQRLADECVVLPLARLPWVWVQRGDLRDAASQRWGPDIARIAGR